MLYEEISRFRFEQIEVLYARDTDTRRVGWMMRPARADLPVAVKEPHIDDVTIRSYARSKNKQYRTAHLSSLFHLNLAHDPEPGGWGSSLLNGSATGRFQLAGQKVKKSRQGTEVITTLRTEDGLRVDHKLIHSVGEPRLTTLCELSNKGQVPIRIRSMTAFNLAGITPYAPDDAPRRLFLHEIRTRWSSEGRHVRTPLEDLLLEPSWAGFGTRCHRIGQVGSMPANGHFPWMAIEDSQAGVFWGVALNVVGSWQMEVSRQGYDVVLSGALGSSDFTHWSPTLNPGENLKTPSATLSCAHGGFEDICQALLTTNQTSRRKSAPDYRIVFNEWGTTWGNPSEARVAALAPMAKALGADVFCIDAGWYADRNGNWGNMHGDWVPSKKAFPGGLRKCARNIARNGLVPGLWFEAETCGVKSRLFQKNSLLLVKDGKRLQVGQRAFLDMTKPASVRYLDRTMAKILRDGGFRYLKLDYNDSIGIGADGADSPGEKLESTLQTSLEYFKSLKKSLPSLTIENCSSGGHRLTNPWIDALDLTSFSDAHEGVEIPIIAANLQAILPSRKNLIWFCARADDSDDRITYGLCATFLGRVCLSGDIDLLSGAQARLIRKGLDFYRTLSPILEGAVWHRYGPAEQSYRHPEGWQSVVRYSADRQSALVVNHSFGNAPNAPVSIPLAPGSWKIKAKYGTAQAKVCKPGLQIHFSRDFQANATVLTLK